MKAWYKAKTGLAVAAAAIALTACGGNGGGDTGASEPQQPETGGNAAQEQQAEPVTLRFFTNNSDRTVGQGKMEQDLIDLYMQENPNVTIKIETLSPDPQYQDKIKVYAASDGLPDIFSSWGNTNFLKPLVASGAVAAIDTADLGGHGFVDAALGAFTFDGKLYGFPRNSDFWVMYYNKQIFADNGLTVPQTEADLAKAIETLKAKDIVPIAMDGRDAWVSGIWFDTMLQRVSGSWETAQKAMDGSGTYDDPATVAAATAMQRWVDLGAFGEGFLNQDYGMARNMFGQGKAAMYMMGNWEMGMAADENFPEEVRGNIGAFALPALDGGQGKASDLPAWFGGGYSVSEKSENKEAAIAFLKWMFKPEHWAKGVWENGITFPAQNYEQLMTGNETELQKDLSAIFNEATSYSGMLAQDKFTADTQKIYYDSVQQVSVKAIDAAAFAKAIADAASKSIEQSKQ
ncbi:MAG TPA: extracellular solute-binding protein [Paenibacillus sp.]|nr:extracellular solute-binding protein [Paenibacillus sp.]